MTTRSFVLDSSAIFDLFSFYPHSHLDTLTPLIEKAVKQKSIYIPEVVFDEITKLDRAAKAWALRNQQLFVPETKAIIERGGAIHDKFRPLVKSKQKYNSADPYVIAYAEIVGATVVTHENDNNEIKIPYVCKQLQIPVMRFPEMADLLRWSASWSQ